MPLHCTGYGFLHRHLPGLLLLQSCNKGTAAKLE
jgi:hypothetical protein